MYLSGAASLRNLSQQEHVAIANSQRDISAREHLNSSTAQKGVAEVMKFGINGQEQTTHVSGKRKGT